MEFSTAFMRRIVPAPNSVQHMVILHRLNGALGQKFEFHIHTKEI